MPSTAVFEALTSPIRSASSSPARSQAHIEAHALQQRPDERTVLGRVVHAEDAPGGLSGLEADDADVVVVFRGIDALRERDCEAEGRALSVLASHTDAATHQRDEVLTDCEAEPGPLLRRPRALGLSEGLEELPQLVLADAVARVLDLERGDAPVTLFPSRAQRDAALVGEFDGVAEQVDEHLSELPLVADDA